MWIKSWYRYIGVLLYVQDDRTVTMSDSYGADWKLHCLLSVCNGNCLWSYLCIPTTTQQPNYRNNNISHFIHTFQHFTFTQPHRNLIRCSFSRTLFAVWSCGSAPPRPAQGCGPDFHVAPCFLLLASSSQSYACSKTAPCLHVRIAAPATRQ
jgi:hypothetical protein